MICAQPGAEEVRVRKIQRILQKNRKMTKTAAHHRKDGGCAVFIKVPFSKTVNGYNMIINQSGQ